MDSGIGSRRRDSVGRELLVVARAEADAASAGREIGNGPAKDLAARIGMDPHVAEGTPGQGQGANQFLRGTAESGVRESVAGSGDFHSPWSTSGAGCDRSAGR